MKISHALLDQYPMALPLSQRLPHQLSQPLRLADGSSSGAQFPNPVVLAVDPLFTSTDIVDGPFQQLLLQAEQFGQINSRYGHD
jgi:hypothetical protein